MTLPDRPPLYRDVGITYYGSEGWPQGLTHNSKEPFEIGSHTLPGYRAYVVEVAARRLRLLDPTQDIDALRTQLADIQALVQVTQGSTDPKMLAVQVKAYVLWGDITAISDRAAWDAAHIRATVQAMTNMVVKNGPKSFEDLVAESMVIDPPMRLVT